MPSPNSISCAQLFKLVGTPTCPTIIDVCIDEDFDADPRLIPTARKYPFQRISEIVPILSGKKVIVVCQKGLKLSQGVSALLRSKGIDSEFLEGGNFSWRDADFPLLPAAKIQEPSLASSTLWVTRHRPKIDRIACPWLIRRFVDPSAQFLFVAPSAVMAVAEKFEAIPFDVEEVHFGHHGDQCSFDKMLEEFALQTEPLLQLAKIVRGADTNRHDLAPEVAGLLAISLGLSRMFRDDLAQLEAGLTIYDALYRWARDAMDEQHASLLQEPSS